MTTEEAKQMIGRYWNEQAASFDDQFLHSIATDAERRAWDRMLDLLAPPGTQRDVLDVGCGTGFLALLFAARGHRVTGTDLAPAMIDRARTKARAQGVAVTFAVDDAESLQLPDAAFDLVVSRHLLWTLPHPGQAVAEWVRVTRPGGRVAVIDGLWSTAADQPDPNSAMRRAYGEAVVAALPFYGGEPAERVVELLRVAGLVNVQTDSLDDLMAAQAARMTEEQRRMRTYVRHLTWGERP
jgi:ubiquinone/menaquinone biosynthesis C-methylase UbiE